MISVEAVRRRVWHYLSPEVGACAGLSVQDLQLFLSGGKTLTPEQLERLARRMGVHDER